nr:SGNH/GDSL hydrolase family protein [Clostridia bacterium]
MQTLNEYFGKYVSNTTAGTTTQSLFESDNSRRIGRIYYKIFDGGRYEYSLLYSSITDSTFSDGSKTVANNFSKAWTIYSLKAGKTSDSTMEEAFEPDSFTSIYFDGKPSKQVEAGEIFATDPFVFEAQAGEFMCIELEYSGELLPFHPEIQIATFVKDGDNWAKNVQLPVPSMVGCNRKVSKKIGYLGDSITQGIGATKNSYRHWNSVTSELLGHEYGYWNIGIGFARAGDAATDGVWLWKAKQLDTVVVCLGTNDMGRVYTPEEICGRLWRVVTLLKDAGVKVIIQSAPPFNFVEEKQRRWYLVNDFIKNHLAPICDGYFDNVPILGKPGEEYMAPYGGHPNDEGSKLWGEALYEYLKDIIN